jgi:sugar/nucleoside kinase (ribokinase family)
MAEQNPTLAGALRRLLTATEFVAPNHDVLSGGDAIACAKELRLAKEDAQRALNTTKHDYSADYLPPVGPGTIAAEGVVVHGPKGCEVHDNGDGSITFRFNPPFTAKVLDVVDTRCDADLRDGSPS